MIGLPFVYTLAGLTFLAFALLSLRDASNAKRWVTRIDRRYGFSDLWAGSRDTTGQLRHRSRKHRHGHRGGDDDEAASKQTRSKKHRREVRKDR